MNYNVKVCDKVIEITKTRGRAIKAYCTDCSGGNRTEVKECPCTMCPLYPFRGYVDWNKVKKEMTEEERIKMTERMNNMRKSSAK